MSTTLEINNHVFTLSSNRGTILKINTHDFKIGREDGTVLTIPRTEMKDPDFDIEDKVEIYKDGKEFIVHVIKPANRETIKSHSRRKINKNVFVWVGAFLGGFFGIDRFMRGQNDMAMMKIFISPLTAFIWTFVDFFIAFYKAYGPSYDSKTDITFDSEGNYIH